MSMCTVCKITYTRINSGLCRDCINREKENEKLRDEHEWNQRRSYSGGTLPRGFGVQDKKVEAPKQNPIKYYLTKICLLLKIVKASKPTSRSTGGTNPKGFGGCK